MRAIRLLCLYLGITSFLVGIIEGILDLFHWPGLWAFATGHSAKAVLGGLVGWAAWRYLPQPGTKSSVLNLTS